MRRSCALAVMLPALLVILSVSQPAHGCANRSAEECSREDASDGWATDHPGLVYTGAIFGAASLVNFGVVGGYSGEQPDEIFYLALTSGAVHYLLGVSLLTAGILLDESGQGAAAQPAVAVSPAGVTLQWSF